MMNCLSVNTDTNEHAFDYASIALATRIIAILRKHHIKVKAVEYEKLLVSIDKPTANIFLAELPTEDETEDYFNDLTETYNFRKDTIMYYNMLLNSFRDGIDSVSHVIFGVAHFDEDSLPDEEEPTNTTESRG